MGTNRTKKKPYFAEFSREVLILGMVALFVRLVGIPIWRHQFGGHELDYLTAFSGDGWQSSTRVYPLLAGFYASLGKVFTAPGILVGINLFAGLATVLAGGIWAKHRWGASVGWMVAVLLCLSPTHAFWSTSIYNVAIPQALLVLAMALGGWRGSLCFAIACNLRIELALMAPALWLLSDWRVATGALGAALSWPLMDSAPHVTAPLEALQLNIWLPDYLGPIASPLGLLLVVLAIQKHNVLLALAALWVHLVGSAFDDYGTRHALLGTLCLIALLATCTGWRRILPVLAGSLFCLKLVCLNTLVQMTPTSFAATLPELPRLKALPADCTEILDDPLAENSHWTHRKSWPSGRVCWGEERIHRAWTSRGLQDRRKRMHRSYKLEPTFILDLESGPRLYYEVSQ